MSNRRNTKWEKRGITFGESKTEQTHKQGTDINHLMKLYARGNLQMPEVDPADYQMAPAITFHEAMNQVTTLQSKFLELPAKLRASFGNDPGQFELFMQNPENHKYLTEHGVMFPEKKSEADLAAEKSIEDNRVHDKKEEQ